MTSKKEKEIRTYIARSIKEGRYEEIAVPEQRSPDTWVPLEQQHAREKKRGRALNNVITNRSPYITTVLKPATGVIAAVAIDPPQNSLLSGIDTDTPIDHQSAAEVAERTYEDMLAEKKRDLAIACALQSQTAVMYEQLIPVAGTLKSLESSLRRLRDFKDSGLKVQTTESLVAFEPNAILTRYIPSASTVQLKIRYCGLLPAQRITHLVALEIPAENAREAKQYFWDQSRVNARLSTIDNLFTLKLLQAAQLMDLDVECVMGKEFDLKTQKWVYSVGEIIDTADLIARLGRVGEVIQEKFGFET